MKPTVDRWARPSSALAVTLLAGAVVGGQVEWDGSCGAGGWTTQYGPSTNWTPEVLPGLSDDVVISDSDPIVLLQGIGLAGEITCDSGLSLQGGLLRLGDGGGFIVGLYVSTIAMPAIEFTVPGVELYLQNAATWSVGGISGAGTGPRRARIGATPYDAIR